MTTTTAKDTSIMNPFTNMCAKYKMLRVIRSEVRIYSLEFITLNVNAFFSIAYTESYIGDQNNEIL